MHPSHLFQIGLESRHFRPTHVLSSLVINDGAQDPALDSGFQMGDSDRKCLHLHGPEPLTVQSLRCDYVNRDT
jgi:hypothetical protein